MAVLGGVCSWCTELLGMGPTLYVLRRRSGEVRDALGTGLDLVKLFIVFRPDGISDEEDGFYYDALRLAAGDATRLKVQSMVGLLPLCAATVVEKCQRERAPRFQSPAFLGRVHDRSSTQ